MIEFGRFTFNETLAKTLLTKEFGEQWDYEGEYEDLDEWSPREFGEEGRIFSLIYTAQTNGVISHPGDKTGMTGRVELIFNNENDEDGGYYRYFIDFGLDLRLATFGEETRKIGDYDARGIDAAVGVLREAVGVANGALARAEAFLNG